LKDIPEDATAVGVPVKIIFHNKNTSNWSVNIILV
jgi:serine acetyltransferase